MNSRVGLFFDDVRMIALPAIGSVVCGVALATTSSSSPGASTFSFVRLKLIGVVIVPRVNVDGAAADRRVLASGEDANRDHLLLSQPEVRALHEAMRVLPPHVVFDHHEFSVRRRWVEKFNGLQGSDVMILEATNPSIARGLSAIAHDLYRPALEGAIARAGLSSFTVAVASSGTTVSGRPEANTAFAAGTSHLTFHSGSGFGLPS